MSAQFGLLTVFVIFRILKGICLPENCLKEVTSH